MPQGNLLVMIGIIFKQLIGYAINENPITLKVNIKQLSNLLVLLMVIGREGGKRTLPLPHGDPCAPSANLHTGRIYRGLNI